MRSANSPRPSPPRFPTIPRSALRGIGEKYFAPLMERPEARALWWPRFLRIAGWFADWETARRGDVAAIDAEIRGEIPIPLDNERTFMLSARADRIERRRDGTLCHPRLQDRAAADRQAGADGAVAAAHAGGGDPARGRLCRHRRPAARSANSAMSGSAATIRRASKRPLELKIKQSDTPQLPDDAADYARAQLEALIRAVRGRGRALYLAQSVDVDEPLRQL